MYGNLVVVSLISIVLLSCPITSQMDNQTSNFTTNLTNSSGSTNTVVNTSSAATLPQNAISSTKTVHDICIDSLREAALREGYPRGSVFYCECSGAVSPYMCNAIFIDVGISATVTCDRNNLCSVKSNLGNSTRG